MMKKGFFEGKDTNQMIKKFIELSKTLKKTAANEEILFAIEVVLKSIVKILEKKSQKVPEKQQNYSFKTSVKKAIDEYTKGFFTFEDDFNEFLNQKYQRFQNYNAFLIATRVLKNKFSKTMLQRNFNRTCLTKNPKHWQEYVYPEYIDSYYLYLPQFYEEPLIYVNSNLSLANYENVLKKEVCFCKAVNFTQVHQIVRNLSIRDLMVRSVDQQDQYKPIAPVNQAHMKDPQQHQVQDPLNHMGDYNS